MPINAPLALNCGLTIKNRLFKSAMSEQLGTDHFAPSPLLPRLYKIWAEGGIGLQITGNVMVDRRYRGEPKNVVIEDDQHLDRLKQWAQEAQFQGAHCWVQLNHPGKQIPNMVCKQPIAPSAIALGKGLDKVFNTPRAMSEADIQEAIERFANAAAIVKQAGFSGVQIHGAHGYLVSQFLSPHHNQRQDRWGGSLDNRMRFVREIYQAIRAQVGDSFAIGIKLNSADFQRGGFSEEDSMIVAETLAGEGIDLIEISGGNYESPAMMGAKASNTSNSSLDREAYFLTYAEKIRQRIDVPLVVTGGFRSRSAMNQALENDSLDMIGLARPLAIYPDMPNQLLNNQLSSNHDHDPSFPLPSLSTGSKTLDTVSMLNITWYEFQLARIAKGQQPNPKMSPLIAALKTIWHTSKYGWQQRRA